MYKFTTRKLTSYTKLTCYNMKKNIILVFLCICMLTLVNCGSLGNYINSGILGKLLSIYVVCTKVKTTNDFEKYENKEKTIERYRKTGTLCSSGNFYLSLCCNYHDYTNFAKTTQFVNNQYFLFNNFKKL